MKLLAAVMCGCLLVGPAQARTEYRLGGENGNSWQAALAANDAGEYLIFAADGQVVGSVPVGATPFGAGRERMLDFVGTSVQPRFIDAHVNLAKTDPDSPGSEIPLPYTGGRIQAATSCVHAGGEVQLMKPMFDGDPSTALFAKVRAQALGGGGGQAETHVHPVMDFTAAIPVNRIRFYPRLGQRDDIRVIEALTAPFYALGLFSPDSFSENILGGYEIRTGDDSINIFITGPCDRTPNGTHSVNENWVKSEDERLDVLKSSAENLEVVVDATFPTRSVRWLTFTPKAIVNWEIAELEVYGEGFVEQAGIVTQIMDFGRPVNWGKIRWDGDFPEGTRLEVRTRTGNTPDPNLYFETDPNGAVVATTKESHSEISFLDQIPPKYDSENWTFWSPVYDFGTGLRDPAVEADAWEDGIPIVSEGIGRYLQLEIQLFGSFTVAPRLDQIAVQFSEKPVAREILGEIWPVDVPSFEPETFTYVIKPRFEEDNTGFDRLEVITHARVEAVRSVTVDGSFAVDLDEFPPLIEDDRFTVGFPFRLADPDSSFKQIEVVFDAPVLRFGTQFTGWVYDSSDPDLIKQRVQPGNATFRFSGDDLSVRSPIGGDLLIDVQIAPNPFTPNGDDVNDQVTLNYKLREVTAGREVMLEIFNLAGRPVATRSSGLTTSGAHQQTWDGRNAAGDLVPPGTYLFRLKLDAAKNEEKIGLFAVAY